MHGILTLIVLLAAVSFAPCLVAGYLQWDDTKHIIENINVFTPLSIEALQSIFSSFINDTYIPLTTLSFHLQYHVVGISPFVTHLINLIGACLNIVLVFVFALQLGLTGWIACIAAGIFAFHPMHVESIAWATERKDILCAFFYLLTLILYQRYLTTTRQHFYWLSLLCGALSILAKSMAVSLPWVLLLLDIFHRGSLTKQRWLEKIPFALVTFPVAALTVFKLNGHPNVLFPDSLLILIWSASFYIQHFFWPYPLLPVYAPALPVTLMNPAYGGALAVMIALITVVWCYRKEKVVLFGVIFFLSTLFFFFRVDFADVNIVADRFIYLPSIGLCLGLGVILGKFPRTIPVLICVILGILTFFQCRIWQNDQTLWRHVLYHQPHNTIAQKKYRSIRFPEALPRIDYAHFNTLLDPQLTKDQAYLKRAVQLLNAGNFILALDDINAALKFNPYLEEAYINRGNIFQSKGDYTQALMDYDHAIAINPNSSALLSKAILLGRGRHQEDALSFFNKAIATGKDTARGLYERGYFFAANKACDRAIADFSAAIIHHNNYTQSYFDRGTCALRLGNLEMAAADFTRVLQLQPANDAAYGQLCHVNLKQQHLSSAIKNCTEAIQLFQYEPSYYNDRAKALFLLGRYSQALADIDRAILLDPLDTQTPLIRHQISQFVKPK